MTIAAKQRGRCFSLVELVVVLVIMAALALIAEPRYAGVLSRYRVERAARRVAADLALSRFQARTSSRSRSIAFNPNLHQYEMSWSTGALSDAPSATTTVKLNAEPYRVKIVSASLGGDTAVTFNGYGVPDSGGAVILQSGPYQKTVVLNADTAKAQVQ